MGWCVHTTLSPIRTSRQATEQVEEGLVSLSNRLDGRTPGAEIQPTLLK